MGQTNGVPPPTRTDPIVETLHGVQVVDPYRWLEEQDSPETRAWIDAQNEHTDALLGSLPGREALEDRLAALMRADSTGIPTERGGRYFFFRRRADQELSVFCLRESLHGEDQVLVDPHPMSTDHTTSVLLWDIATDGTVVVYGVRRGGEDEADVRLLDVGTRADLPDSLPRARYFSVSLAADKRGLYYVRHGDEGPRVYYHALGTGPATDVELFGSSYGPEKIIVASLSEDGRYLLITVYHGAAADKTEVYVQDVAAGGAVIPIVNDVDARFTGEIAGNTLFLHTNWQAPNGRILAVDLANPAREAWREVVPAGSAVIEGFSAAGGRLFLNTLKDVVSHLQVVATDGRALEEIPLPALGSVSGVAGRWESGEAFFSFSSFHVPPTIYRHDVAAGRQEVWARQEVPVESDAFEVKQAWFRSQDGTRVPMFLMHRRGLVLNGTHPALLTGYGGFNASLTPAFAARAVLWAERGGVFAAANLRGGGEMGEEWHRAGMRDKKQNVFDDFIAAAEWLVKDGYTRPSRLAISGGSNGGLLVGAALTQRPDLFRAVVCSYPLLDMVRYHRFLVAGFWVPEYGSSDDAAQFRTLHAYSPYHHVAPGVDYPAVLFITGDADTRVAPLHARKMAARLQAASASDRPILLHYDTKAGHSGGRPVGKLITDLVDELSFLFWQLSG